MNYFPVKRPASKTNENTCFVHNNMIVRKVKKKLSRKSETFLKVEIQHNQKHFQPKPVFHLFL